MNTPGTPATPGAASPSPSKPVVWIVVAVIVVVALIAAWYMYRAAPAGEEGVVDGSYDALEAQLKAIDLEGLDKELGFIDAEIGQ